MNPTFPKLTFFALTLLSGVSAAAAPLTPDAGQTSREVQRQPLPEPPPSASPLRGNEENAGETPDGPKTVGDILIDVKGFSISGNKAVPVSALEALLADLTGGTHTVKELNAGAARITAWYRARGYAAAQAYLPEQDIKEGIVLIKVLEGLIGERLLNNQSQLSDDLTNSYLQNIHSGDAVQTQIIDRALLLLKDTPGVGGIRASLQPGASVGTTDLLIELDPASLINANIELDNYGNRYTGEYRAGTALALNSPFNLGDQLSVRLLASAGNMTYARMAYQFPVGGDGLRIGGAYADTRYQLGKEFTSLQAHGSASNISVYATYPLMRSQLRNLSATLTLERKKLVDQTDVPASSSDKQILLINAGLAGNMRDSLLGGGVTAFDAALVAGKLGMDAVSLATDASSAQSNGTYAKISYSLNRLQRLSDSDILSLALSGQQATKNLNSSEKFSLGGANGVRAYPQGEGGGDDGMLVNLEARHNLTEDLQGIAFFDAGSVTVDHTPYASTANSRKIAGAGVGANTQFWGMQFKTSVAWRTSGGQAQAEPATVNNTPRIWLQLSGQF